MPATTRALVAKDRKVVISNYNFTDDAGSQGTLTLFTVTGDVLLTVFGICDVALEGVSSVIEVGVAGNTAVLIDQTTAAGLIANEIWHDASPTTTIEKVDLNAAQAIIANGQDIVLTIGTADLTAGDVDFYAVWRPLSSDGLVVAA